MILEDFNQIKNSSIDWNRFESKTILITGANGFLPAYMVETLLLLNNDILNYSPCKVIALVRNEKHIKERFSNYLSDENLKIIV
jgi:thioester reductase-like protein